VRANYHQTLQQACQWILLDLHLHHKVLSRLLAAHLHRRVHLNQLLTLRQINPLLKVEAVVSPKQARLKQQVIVTVKQVLV
jgi:hypothetical protein